MLVQRAVTFFKHMLSAELHHIYPAVFLVIAIYHQCILLQLVKVFAAVCVKVVQVIRL